MCVNCTFKRLVASVYFTNGVSLFLLMLKMYMPYRPIYKS